MIAMPRTLFRYRVIDQTKLTAEELEVCLAVLGREGYMIVHCNPERVILSQPTGQEFLKVEPPGWAQIAAPGPGMRVQ